MQALSVCLDYNILISPDQCKTYNNKSVKFGHMDYCYSNKQYDLYFYILLVKLYSITIRYMVLLQFVYNIHQCIGIVHLIRDKGD